MGTFSVWHWLVVALLIAAAYGVYMLIRPRNPTDLVGVRGWLLLLVLGLMFIGPVAGIIQTNTVFFLAEYEEPALRNLSAWQGYKTAAWLLVAVASALSFFAGLGLADRKRDFAAVKRAKVIIWLVGPVGILVGAFVSYAFLDHIDGLGVAGKLIGSSIGAAIWSSYLSRSRRVKATYGGGTGQESASALAPQPETLEGTHRQASPSNERRAFASSPPARTSPKVTGKSQELGTILKQHTTRAASSTNGPFTNAEAQMTQIDNEEIYARVGKELEAGERDIGLWTMTFAECEGDETKTRVAYIKRRFEKLRAEEGRLLEAAEQERQQQQAEKDRVAAELVQQSQEARRRVLAYDYHDEIKRLRASGLNWRFLDLCAAGNVGEVQDLLAREPFLIASTTPDGGSAIRLAISNEQKEVVKVLLKAGALVGVVNTRGFSAVDLAKSSPAMANLVPALEKAAAQERDLWCGGKPVGMCPNCTNLLPSDTKECLICGAAFGQEGSWAPSPTG